ncbi:unnamed protein product [Effrenium voratum]|uniref:Rab-GAP TBC domain-containing protein n=1 Tax=Effrenium voratum TaxID=2562239 RepID=A0AA36MXZ6_9DINO|nr:unnamed protein product [Effrenium voratum]CAJ1383821.1 unnamed protein product [Effrenium voratum]CAJ1413863.1 unnamed protein product [Effrenium voratum]
MQRGEALEAQHAWGLLISRGLLSHLPLPEAKRCAIVSPWLRRLSECKDQECQGSGLVSKGLPGGITQPVMEILWREELGARRAGAWQALLLGGINLPRDSEDYERLCAQTCSYDSAIRLDVHRTLPQEALFKESDGRGQGMLFRLLRALAIRLTDIGYCQSLNFVMATMILVFPDDEVAAFNCALALLLRHALVDLYRPKFQKLEVVLWQFDRLVEGFLPKVHAALMRHGVNSEYYAIQWFLTLYASDLPQSMVRRIWDRFLVAGWRVIAQVGLVLLYRIQDALLDMDTCRALVFLKRFTRNIKFSAEELLDTAATFKVSHRMLSALEAAHGWQEPSQLTVIKDLNSGHVHWIVQAISPEACDEPEDSSRCRSYSNLPGHAGGRSCQQGKVLPFLLHNLDTGETTMMEKAFSQYKGEMHEQARAKAGPAQAAPSSADMPAVSALEAPAGFSGSFWMQTVQRQAERRLAQA